jgi:hypothetical protein
MAFELYFDPNAWDFSRGGKIGGWFVGKGVASGYRHSPDGASHRFMWQNNGAAQSYIYPPAGMRQKDPKLKPEGHGVGYFQKDLFRAGTLKVGQWNKIELGIKVNSFDSSGKPRQDGMSQLTVNGKSGVLDGIIWAAKPETKITSFQINSFFGGPSPAVKDSISYIRGFKLYEWKD